MHLLGLRMYDLFNVKKNQNIFQKAYSQMRTAVPWIDLNSTHYTCFMLASQTSLDIQFMIQVHCSQLELIWNRGSECSLYNTTIKVLKEKRGSLRSIIN